MSCPDLADLPPPPTNKKGWPWTERSEPLPPTLSDGVPWPRITVVTPSFNQVSFLEATIRSVLLQAYPNLEYLVLDGGSADGSVEIIKKYERWIDYWVSEPDGGQSAAINRGLAMGSGRFAAWINSDDMLYQSGLFHHATRVGFDDDKVFIGLCAYMDLNGRVLRLHRSRIETLEDLLRVPQIWRRGGNIVQPEVMFPRLLALDVGGLDPNNHYSMDYELWGKFLLAGTRLQKTNVPFGMLRRHPEQKTADGMRTTESMIATARALLERADMLSSETRTALDTELRAYLQQYPERHWRRTGRLAAIGLPRPVVNILRSGRKKLHDIFPTKD